MDGTVDAARLEQICRALTDLLATKPGASLATLAAHFGGVGVCDVVDALDALEARGDVRTLLTCERRSSLLGPARANAPLTPYYFLNSRYDAA